MKFFATTIFLFLTLLTAAQAQSRQEYSYGPDPRQRIDVYGASQAEAAPVIVMLHGGAWRTGDKRSRAVWQSKVGYWVPQGYTFISVDTRLLPAADPVEQAEDLAMALAFIQRHAASWGADPNRIVLMGHSAGAHVAGLVATRNDIASAAGVRPWRGTVLLDSAALDVPALMQDTPMRLHRRAFGARPAFWQNASPAAYLDRRDRPMLIVCSTQRDEPCPAAQAFQSKAAQSGVAVTVQPANMSHRQINAELGEAQAYTRIVDNWIDAQLN